MDDPECVQLQDNPVALNCPCCDKKYKCYQTLKAHVSKAHPNHVNELQSPPKPSVVVVPHNCPFCEKKYISYQFLKFHVLKAHPNDVNKLECPPKPRIKVGSHNCPCCDKKYSYYRGLKDHVGKNHPNHVNELKRNVRKKHPKHVNELQRKLKPRVDKHYNYKCTQCHARFNHLKNLTYHRKKVHAEYVKLHEAHKLHNPHKAHKLHEAHKCCLCSNNFSKANILRHFEEEHNLKIEESAYEFSSFDEFLKWKEEKEKDTKSKFVQECGCSKGLTFTTHRFACHRSGELRATGEGKKRIKTQGSSRIGGYCPASICAKQYKDGKCSVVFKSTHVGHENDLGHLRLSRTEKEAIAMKIALQIPFDTILNEIRDSVSESSVERIHLLTKKDLHNIAAQFKLQSSAVRHKKDAVSVESWGVEPWVTKMDEKDCILIYKPQDVTVPEYPEFEKSDFALGIMNDAQADILKKFGNDCICLDGTHGTNANGIQLITILVLDDLQQGFPCAFFLSNRTDERAISIFLKTLKDKIGDIFPNVFMSDVENSFFNAWKNIMGIPMLHLFCTWHVDSAWRQNLNKIVGKENQVKVYKTLRRLLEERDIGTFKVLLPKVLNEWKQNPNTTAFANYISDCYLNCVSSWAYCYRLHSGININMHLEYMHKTLQHVYSNGKNGQGLDKSINAIMTFVRDKIVDRLVVLNKGKITTKLRNLRKQHKYSLALSENSVQENNHGWSVASSEATEFYEVKKSVKNCSCQLQCQDCNACIHNYTCTCTESAVKWNMCKHIHLVCRIIKLKTAPILNTCNESDNLLVVDIASIESQSMIYELGGKNLTKVASSNLSIASLKEETLNICKGMLDLTKTREQVEAFKKLVLSAEPTILAMQKEAD